MGAFEIVEKTASPQTAKSELADLIGRFESLRRHHAYICANLKSGVYPVSEAETVGNLVDDLAREISAKITGWRDLD